MMKRLGIALIVFAGFAGAVAAQTDVVRQLGSNAQEAQETIFSSFSSGTVYPIGTKSVFKSATDEAKVAMVQGVIAFARTYSTSADFAKRYATYREGQKPSPPSGPQTGDDVRAAQRKGYQDGIANLEKTMKAMPQMAKDLEPTLNDLKAQLKALDTDKAANAEMDKIMKQSGQMQAEGYKQQVAQWEQQYPVDPKSMIVSRLRQFLETSATVDFTAKLVPSKFDPKQMQFANPAYEKKDNQWKMLYRAGKPAVDAARAAAQEWLKAIGG